MRNRKESSMSCDVKMQRFACRMNLRASYTRKARRLNHLHNAAAPMLFWRDQMWRGTKRIFRGDGEGGKKVSG